MDLALWIVAILLAVGFAVFGLPKLLIRHEELVEKPHMGWASDFPPVIVKLIGLFEVLAAVTIVLPPLVGVAEWLVPLAAAALVLDMAGALVTHTMRGDAVRSHMPPLVLGLLSLALAIGRFRIEPF